MAPLPQGLLESFDCFKEAQQQLASGTGGDLSSQLPPNSNNKQGAGTGVAGAVGAPGKPAQAAAAAIAQLAPGLRLDPESTGTTAAENPLLRILSAAAAASKGRGLKRRRSSCSPDLEDAQGVDQDVDQSDLNGLHLGNRSPSPPTLRRLALNGFGPAERDLLGSLKSALAQANSQQHLQHQPLHLQQQQPSQQQAVQRHPCAQCDQSFDTDKMLQQHQQAFHAEKNFVCEICNKAFRFRSNLAEHRSVHTALKPFVCKFCGKSSRLKGE